MLSHREGIGVGMPQFQFLDGSIVPKVAGTQGEVVVSLTVTGLRSDQKTETEPRGHLKFGMRISDCARLRKAASARQARLDEPPWRSRDCGSRNSKTRHEGPVPRKIQGMP